MFGTIRKHSQALWIPIIIVIVISFVVYFTPGFDPLDNRGNRRSETDDELKYARQQVLLEQALNLYQRFGGMLPPRFDADALSKQMQPHNLMGNDFQTQQQLGDLDDYPGLDYQTQLRMLRLKKARALGIEVGLDTVVVRIEEMFSQPGSGFSQEIYTSFLTPLARAGFLHFDGKKKEVSEIGKGQFREFIREGIILGHPMATQREMGLLDRLMTSSSGFFPDSAVKASLIEANKKYTAHAVFFSSSNHLASVTNAIDSNSTLITNHYQTLTDQYRIPPKRVIGYVKVANANYLPAVEREIEFDKLVTNRIKLHHSSTNSVDFFRDTNGTNKLPGGPRLIAAAQADIRKKFEPQFKNLTKSRAQAEATTFFEHIFEDQPEDNWTLARLKQESAAWNGEDKQPLHYQESTVSGGEDYKVLHTNVVDAIYGSFVSATKGELYPRLIEASEDGFYLIGLVDVIAGRPRKFDDLNDKEKYEVKESFIKADAKSRTREEANDFRKGVKELIEAGQSFADSIRLSPNPTVNLPAMKLNGTNQVAELKGLATLDQIQSTIRSNPEEVKKGWISEFTPTANNQKGDGFIVNVSAVEPGEPPTPTELQNEAESQRQNARRFSSSMMAARFGMVPSWLQADVQALNTRLYLQSLEQREKNIEFEIENKLDEAKENEQILIEINTGKSKVDEQTKSGLEKSLTEARREIQRLKQIQTELPNLIKKAKSDSGGSVKSKK